MEVRRRRWLTPPVLRFHALARTDGPTTESLAAAIESMRRGFLARTEWIDASVEALRAECAASQATEGFLTPEAKPTGGESARILGKESHTPSNEPALILELIASDAPEEKVTATLLSVLRVALTLVTHDTQVPVQHTDA
eukprot:CAMPEP_0197397894 /NCGR_PEP_ID=MMETSP1165-20131217/12310_1 /TAXON_ID=284809 /ORGANISM="Chrysocystis fragilis, Strain CCMP3189" /LENGTH=139 /DNA_ID=CAMNT_0042923815 /DNA_START=353 /DNA_END=773 /DNA_ORIENTATION=-